MPGEQPILAGRSIMRPAVDLNLYRCKAVVDWLEIRLETSGRHQALNIHRKAQGILSAQGSAATLFVYGPRRETRYIGSSFILRIQQPQSHQLVPFLKAVVAEYAPDTLSVADLIVEGIELSVDFYAARDTTAAPLPWPSIAPPFTVHRRSCKPGSELFKLHLVRALRDVSNERSVTFTRYWSKPLPKLATRPSYRNTARPLESVFGRQFGNNVQNTRFKHIVFFETVRC